MLNIFDRSRQLRLPITPQNAKLTISSNTFGEVFTWNTLAFNSFESKIRHLFRAEEEASTTLVLQLITIDVKNIYYYKSHSSFLVLLFYLYLKGLRSTNFEEKDPM